MGIRNLLAKNPRKKCRNYVFWKRIATPVCGLARNDRLFRQPLQKKKACNAGFFLLLLYFLISLNTSAMSMSYMCWSMRVTMLL